MADRWTDKTLAQIKAVLERLPMVLVADEEPGWYNLRDSNGSFWLDIRHNPGAVDDWDERLRLALDAVACMARPVRALVAEYEAVQQLREAWSALAHEKDAAWARVAELETRLAEVDAQNAAQAWDNVAANEKLAALDAERIEHLAQLMDSLSYIGFYIECEGERIYDAADMSSAEDTCDLLAKYGLAEQQAPDSRRYWHIFPEKLATMEADHDGTR